MILFCDTSALISLLFKQADYKKIEKLIAQADELLVSNLLQAELYAVVTREKGSIFLARNLLGFFSTIYPDRSLEAELETLFAKTYCRGPDAYHLACCLYVDSAAAHVSFMSRDKMQVKAAKEVGFETL